MGDATILIFSPERRLQKRHVMMMGRTLFGTLFGTLCARWSGDVNDNVIVTDSCPKNSYYNEIIYFYELSKLLHKDEADMMIN